MNKDQFLKIKIQDRIDRAYLNGNKANEKIQSLFWGSWKKVVSIIGIVIAILWFIGGSLDFMHKRNQISKI